MKIISPPRLKKGDLVTIISPSAGLAPFAMHRIEQGKKALEDMGLKVKVEANALLNAGHVSGTIEQRIADLHSAFADKDVKAIICTIGGNHSNQLLKHLDWKLIKNNPKIFLGYSDITVLHHAILKKTGLITFYGPCLMTEFGEYPEMNIYNKKYVQKALIHGEIGNIEPSKEWTDEFLNWFTKDDQKRKREYKINTGFKWWREGKSTGNIIGGAIPSINHLVGTEYWNKFKGKIFFLDLPEGNNPGEGISISDFDAYLSDLFNLDVFKGIKGLIIGRPYSQNNESLEKIEKIIKGYTKGTKYPILYGVDIGHTSPMITIPMGAKVLLDSKLNKFVIQKGFID